MPVSLTDPNTGRAMEFASQDAIDYKVAMRSGYVPTPGLLSTQVGTNPQYSTIQSKTYTADPNAAFNEQMRVNRPQGTVWDSSLQQYIDPLSKAGDLSRTGGVPSSGGFFSGYAQSRTDENGNQIIDPSNPEGFAGNGMRFNNSPTLEYEIAPGVKATLTQEMVDKAAGMVKAGSTSDYWNRILQEGSAKGMVNIKQLFAPQVEPGVLSSEAARNESRDIAFSLDQSGSDMESFYKMLMDRNETRAKEDQAMNEQKSLAEQQSLAGKHDQDTNTLKAAQYKTGRTGSMFATSELLQLSETQRAEMNNVKLKYEELSLQSRRALEDGQVALAKEYREAAIAEKNQYIQLAQLQMQREEHDLQAAKLEREEATDFFKNAVAAGFVPSDEYLAYKDKKAGWDIGTSKLMYQAADAEMQRTQMEKQLAMTKDTLEIEKLQQDLASNVTKSMGDIADVIAKFPAGTPVKIGDSTYFGTDLGNIEVNNDGEAFSSVVDPLTGQLITRSLGTIGKADVADLETVYQNGVPILRNKKTKQQVAMTTPNGGPVAGDLACDRVYPEGYKGTGAYGPLQCGEFMHEFSDSYPYGLNTWQQKAAAVTVDKSQGPQVGYTVFQKTGGENGHVALVTWVGKDADGDLVMKLTEANYKSAGEVTHTRLLKADDATILGYRNDPLKENWQKMGSRDNDGESADAQEQEYETTPSGLKIQSASPFVTGTQNETQYQAASQKEQDARMMADQIMSGDLIPDSKKFDPVQSRALQIAKENGYLREGDKPEIEVPEFKDWVKTKERSMVDEGYVMSPNSRDLKTEYEIQKEGADAIANAFSLQAGGITPQRFATLKKSVMEPLQAGDMDLAVDNLMTGAFRAEQATQRKQYDGVSAINAQLDNFANTLDAYIAAGGTTDIFSGTLENMLQKVGTIKDPKRRALASQLQTALNDYRYSVTGAAFTESEAKLYDQMFPGITKDPELNRALIDGLKRGFTAKKTQLVKQTLGNNFYEKVMKPIRVIDLETDQEVSIPAYKFDSRYYKRP